MENSKSDSLKNTLIYILMFLIGLNFKGYAIAIIYLMFLFVFLFVERSFFVPKAFLWILSLFFWIIFSRLISREPVTKYDILKNGIYPVLFITAYNIGMYQKKREKSIIEAFYMCVFSFSAGNMFHLGLDMLYTNLRILNMGNRVLNDIWSGSVVPTTIVVGWGCLVAPVLFYSADGKKKKLAVMAGLCMAVLYIFFSLIVATRLGIVNMILLIIVFLLLRISNGDLRINLNRTIIFLLFSCIVVCIFIKVVPYIASSNLFTRLSHDAISLFDSNGRFAASAYLLDHFTECMCGGGYFTEHYGIPQHNIWFQIYDLYGTIPFAIYAIVLSQTAKKLASALRLKGISYAEKRFLVLFFMALMLYCFEEPAYTSNLVITGMLPFFLGTMCVLLMPLEHKQVETNHEVFIQED